MCRTQTSCLFALVALLSILAFFVAFIGAFTQIVPFQATTVNGNFSLVAYQPPVVFPDVQHTVAVCAALLMQTIIQVDVMGVTGWSTFAFAMLGLVASVFAMQSSIRVTQADMSVSNLFNGVVTFVHADATEYTVETSGPVPFGFVYWYVQTAAWWAAFPLLFATAMAVMIVWPMRHCVHPQYHWSSWQPDRVELNRLRVAVAKSERSETDIANDERLKSLYRAQWVRQTLLQAEDDVKSEIDENEVNDDVGSEAVVEDDETKHMRDTTTEKMTQPIAVGPRSMRDPRFCVSSCRPVRSGNPDIFAGLVSFVGFLLFLLFVAMMIMGLLWPSNRIPTIAYQDSPLSVAFGVGTFAMFPLDRTMLVVDRATQRVLGFAIDRSMYCGDMKSRDDPNLAKSSLSFALWSMFTLSMFGTWFSVQTAVITAQSVAESSLTFLNQQTYYDALVDEARFVMTTTGYYFLGLTTAEADWSASMSVARHAFIVVGAALVSALFLLTCGLMMSRSCVRNTDLTADYRPIKRA